MFRKSLRLKTLWLTSLLFSSLALHPSINAQPLKSETSDPDLNQQFLSLITQPNTDTSRVALAAIKQNWNVSMVPMALEAFYFSQSYHIRGTLGDLLETTTGTDNLDKWYQWLWNRDVTPTAEYDNFKADLYRLIDPRFEQYFRQRENSARVRLDEIRWGGVRQDGIPPLRNPKMLSAEEAGYLEDDHIIFGIKVNGDARAYPKRILAWHEMFTDTIGGVPIAGVYCTLCGTVIPFRTEVNGTSYRLGTSGFLYRSNKLMYDQATQSLWSTERGEPVLGPLVDKGIVLPYESVVTTTWGAWRKRHPNTTVLPLETGHQRDYAEGVAYNEYFATDELMFNTPFNDNRLANKQEILALRFAAAPDEQLAIDTDFLQRHPLYKNQIGRQKFVVFTDDSGANRVYDPAGTEFVSYDGDQRAKDKQGNIWTVGEEWLENSEGKRLNRLPYHRAFWFGWHAAFPQTKLIK